jgi:hypothetical protein
VDYLNRPFAAGYVLGQEQELSSAIESPSRIALRVWTYGMPDGKLEQYQIAPIG